MGWYFRFFFFSFGNTDYPPVPKTLEYMGKGSILVPTQLPYVR